MLSFWSSTCFFSALAFLMVLSIFAHFFVAYFEPSNLRPTLWVDAGANLSKSFDSLGLLRGSPALYRAGLALSSACARPQ